MAYFAMNKTMSKGTNALETNQSAGSAGACSPANAAAAQNTLADLALINGVIYTADANDTVHEALAIKGNRIIFAGGNAEIRNYIGARTKVIDLQGKMVMPGMLDTHIHPPGLSLLALYEVPLFKAKSVEGYVAAVKDFIARHPGIRAVYGRGWSWSVLKGEEAAKGPRKEHLDAVAADIPVVLRANDGHTLWVNSRALAVNGITRETAAPQGGVIEKDPVSGELWGTLKEGAMGLIALPEYTLEQYKEALSAFQSKMHSFGITGIICFASLPFKTIFQAFAALQKEGKLALRVRGAMTVNPQDDLAAQFAAINEVRVQYATPDLKVTAAKFFADGVVEGGTSFLLEPYAQNSGRGPHYRGEPWWDPEKLKQAFLLANLHGLQIHVHSTGDAATKYVLDALEYARAALPAGDCRNTITHLQLVDKADIPRFRKLGVIASVQPYWHAKGPHWWHNVDYRLLGARAEEEFPLASFFANGVIVASSSDYPASNVPNPLFAIEVGVTRSIATGSLYGVEDPTDTDDPRYLLNKRERATVQQMLHSFTINGAYAMFMEDAIGSIEAGKLADIVVLDQNLLAVNPLDIDKVKVVMTFFDGRLVYEA